MAEVLERIIPGNTDKAVFLDHEERYQFAGQFVSGKRVLDAASGPGIGTDYLMQCGALECVGIDIDLESVEGAASLYSRPKFLTGNILEMPFPSRSFDVVVSMETIEHIREHEEFVTECARVLRPDGMLICSTPNHRVSSWLYRQNNPYHLRECDAPDLHSLLCKHFKEVDLYSQRPKIRYWEIAKQVTVVPVLRKLGILDRVLNATGRAEAASVESSTTFRVGHPNFPPYRVGDLHEPTVVIAVAKGPAQ